MFKSGEQGHLRLEPEVSTKGSNPFPLYMVSAVVSADTLYQVETVYLYSYLSWVGAGLYQMLFSASIDIILWFFFTLLMWWIIWVDFQMLNQALNTWDKPYLAVVYSSCTSSVCVPEKY